MLISFSVVVSALRRCHAAGAGLSLVSKRHTQNRAVFSAQREDAMGAAAPESGELTQLLARWAQGDSQSGEHAVALVYQELKRLAGGLLSGGAGGVTLQPTALVNEALLKLLGAAAQDFDNRAHFFGAAGRAMRQVLVDRARRRFSEKRGSGEAPLTLEHAPEISTGSPVDLLELDTALRQLEALDPQQVRIVELRYFVGLSIEETAAVLNLHPSAVNREWAMARAWLKCALTSP
jgi:RNA polymerase sigma factor (TIGR02999 family)